MSLILKNWPQNARLDMLPTAPTGGWLPCTLSLYFHRIAKDQRFERLPCLHKGTYADDCIVQRIMQVCIQESAYCRFYMYAILFVILPKTNSLIGIM